MLTSLSEKAQRRAASVVDFIKDHTRGWRLRRVIIKPHVSRIDRERIRLAVRQYDHRARVD